MIVWFVILQAIIMIDTQQQINPASIAIALTTSYPGWYRGKLASKKHTDKIRGDLALEFIRLGSTLGYQLVVADWQSPKTFRKKLGLISGIILIKRRSGKRSPSKRQALQRAVKLPGIKVVVLTEPEKISLVQDCLQKIVQPILTDEADIIVPKRSDELFKQSYPDYQYESEVEGNRTYNEELRSHKLIDLQSDDLDMFFGPRAFANKRPIVSLFMKRYQFTITHASFPAWYFDAEELSNAAFFPIVAALKKELRVKSVEVPFRYPKLQKENEESGQKDFFIIKRNAQRIGLIVELLHFVAYLEKYHGVRVKAI